MIDLHCHLLPGLDDGAVDMAEAVRMARLAAAEGCDVVVATPHQRHPAWWNDDREAIEVRCRELQERVGEWPRILPGAEVWASGALIDEIDRFPGGGLLPLAGSRYLLLELEPGSPTVDAARLVHELVVHGWTPILAHPEHIPWLRHQRSLARRLVSLGALFQVTAMSLTGGSGRRALAACRDFLDAGLVHFVASDAHGADVRPPGLWAAYDALATTWGEEAAEALTAGNPAAVVDDRALAGPVPCRLPAAVPSR